STRSCAASTARSPSSFPACGSTSRTTWPPTRSGSIRAGTRWSSSPGTTSRRWRRRGPRPRVSARPRTSSSSRTSLARLGPSWTKRSGPSGLPCTLPFRVTTPSMPASIRSWCGEDLGQHSWVAPVELRADLARLALAPTSRLLDLGCGPCGPLVEAIAATGCRGTGFDRSRAALGLGRAQAKARGVADRLTLHEGDLDQQLPFPAGSFDAALSLDVLVHVRDRAELFREVARVLAPGGRFLFTDAGVVTGLVSSE